MPDKGDPLDWFVSLFRGNAVFYTIHQPPFTEKEDGKVKGVWCGTAEYGTKSFPFVPPGREKGDLVPVTKETYRDHLNGKAGLALIPVMDSDKQRNVCFYGALDIDVPGVDYTWFIKKLYGLGFKFVPARSKSGGLHVYFFFPNVEPAEKVIEVLKKVVEVLALNKLYAKRVEIFPKQAVAIPGDRKFANGLLLPFFNIANPTECPNRMYSSEGQLVGIRNAQPLVGAMFTTLEEIGKTIDDLPYRDAPYCIQALLLTGALFQEGDHRNDFLFTAALYLKLKEKDGFYDSLRAMNDRLEGPLEETDLEDIFESVTTKDYQIWGQCKKQPMEAYCDKTLCRQRVYGLGKEKGNVVSDIEFGRAIRVLTRNPYYLIEVRVAGTESYAQIRVDDTADLMNQRAIQRACIRQLKYAPASMKQAAWLSRLNSEVLGKIEDQRVSETSDMTEESLLHQHFLRYLTHGQTQNSAPYMVALGHVYYRDGVYSFDGGGFKSYLATLNFKLTDMNLRAELESYGCTEGKLSYTTAKGAEKTIACWQKAEDETLREMCVFYDEIYGENAEAVKRIKLEKDNEEVSDGDDTRF